MHCCVQSYSSPGGTAAECMSRATVIAPRRIAKPSFALQPVLPCILLTNMEKVWHLESATDRPACA
jgi:hypothetical protein